MKNKERGIVQVPGKALTQTDGLWNKISAILRDATDNYTTSHNGIIHEACPYIADAAPASCITTLSDSVRKCQTILRYASSHYHFFMEI